jgi:hypothetical protein
MWPTLDDQFRDAEAVFVGDVEDVRKVKAKDCADERIRFRPSRTWKGVLPGVVSIEVLTSTTGRLADGSRTQDPNQVICIGGCGAAVDPGERYVVFAYAQDHQSPGNGTHLKLAISCTDILRDDDPDYSRMLSRLDELASEQR